MAGPVVAAAVIFPPEIFIKGVNDSKQLPPEQREELFPQIHATRDRHRRRVAAIPAEVDQLNIFWATMAASERALAALCRAPDHVLVDGRRIPELKLPQTRIVGGDRKSFCIAAASIIAKVTRDRMMVELDVQYPGLRLRTAQRLLHRRTILTLSIAWAPRLFIVGHSPRMGRRAAQAVLKSPASADAPASFSTASRDLSGLCVGVETIRFVLPLKRALRSECATRRCSPVGSARLPYRGVCVSV